MFTIRLSLSSSQYTEYEDMNVLLDSNAMFVDYTKKLIQTTKSFSF